MQAPRVTLEPFGSEYWPLDKLRQLQEQRLYDGRLLQQAACSSLYAGRWPRLAKLAGRQGLQSLPFTTADDLLQAQNGRRLQRLAVASPYLWLSSAAIGDRKWLPCAPADLLRSMGLMARLIRLLQIEPCEVLLCIAPPAPLFQNSLPYLWMCADRWGTGLHLELVAGSMAMAEHSNWPEFALRRQPATLIARPSDALALAGRFAQAAGPGAALPRDAFSRLRRGLFYGEALAPHRSRIEKAYGLEAFGCYASAEFPYYACECQAHDGLHIWLDLAIPEIIPDEELAPAHSRQSHRPDALFLDQAPAGTSGELVVTTFGHALPMVRYRTGDRVRVISLAPCACGSTHPRIEVLGRL